MSHFRLLCLCFAFQTTFALPDMRGRIAVGAGTRDGITWTVGTVGGSTTTTLTSADVSGHEHGSNAAGSTVGASASAEINIAQPHVVLQFWMATAGVFPPRQRRRLLEFETESVSGQYVSSIMITAWTQSAALTNWLKCEGQILPISQNTALFSLLGVVYGGDGEVNSQIMSEKTVCGVIMLTSAAFLCAYSCLQSTYGIPSQCSRCS